MKSGGGVCQCTDSEGGALAASLWRRAACDAVGPSTRCARSGGRYRCWRRRRRFRGGRALLSERRVVVRPRPSLLTLFLPHRTAVSRGPGWWRPETGRLLLHSGRASARGVPGPLRARVSRSSAHLLPWGRGRGPQAWPLRLWGGIALCGVWARRSRVKASLEWAFL